MLDFGFATSKSSANGELTPDGLRKPPLGVTPGNFTKVVALILILESKVDNKRSPNWSTMARGIDIRLDRTYRQIDPDVMLQGKKRKEDL